MNRRRLELAGIWSVVLALSLTMTFAVEVHGVPYRGVGPTTGVETLSGCPPSEEECILILGNITCVDYDINTKCLSACVAACYIGCLFTPVPSLCSFACGAACVPACRYCEEFEYEYIWYCYCPGDPVPTISIPPVPLEE